MSALHLPCVYYHRLLNWLFSVLQKAKWENKRILIFHIPKIKELLSDEDWLCPIGFTKRNRE